MDAKKRLLWVLTVRVGEWAKPVLDLWKTSTVQRF
jgi:hypothetical protein